MFPRVCAFLLLTLSAFGQPTNSYRIDTVAGTLPPYVGIPALDAVVALPQALAAGSDGTIYVADGSLVIRKFLPDGEISRVGGGLAGAVAVGPDDTVYSVG